WNSTPSIGRPAGARRRRKPLRDVQRATAGAAWAVDGNYGAVQELLWHRATHLIWLDYGRGLIMTRVIRRSLWRLLTRRPLWNGNREQWRSWLTPEHPIRWAWATWQGRRARFAALLEGGGYPRLRVLRLVH